MVFDQSVSLDSELYISPISEILTVSGRVVLEAERQLISNILNHHLGSAAILLSRTPLSSVENRPLSSAR